MRARASTTLRKYGFCEVEGEAWTKDEAQIATRLLEGLQAIGEERRKGQWAAGDDDAWLWPDEPPRLDELTEAQVARLVAERGGGDAKQECVQRVGERLLGPYHVDRVKEVLGCLIPKDMHPRYDDKKPRGKAGTCF